MSRNACHGIPLKIDRNAKNCEVFKFKFEKSLLPQITSTSTTHIHAGISKQRGVLKQEELIGPSMGCEHN